MVYKNLKPVSLPATYINPSMRDALVYSNMHWPCNAEAFMKFFSEAVERISHDEELIKNSYPRISEALDMPVYKYEAKAIGVIDKLFGTIDSGYKPFGASLPRITLKVFSGIVCSQLKTSEWEERCGTLLHKFPDLEKVWNKELHASSIRVLEIVKKIEVYYERAEFLASDKKIADQADGGSIVDLQAARARHERLARNYQAHLSATAPYLDSADGEVNFSGADVTDVFGSLLSKDE